MASIAIQGSNVLDIMAASTALDILQSLFLIILPQKSSLQEVRGYLTINEHNQYPNI